MTQVVAAIIEVKGEILICQRKPEGAHPLKWEFPGGKVEAGEIPERALARELQEELAIRAVVGAEIVRYEYSYPGRTPILLKFYRVREFEGEPQNLDFHAVRWVSVERLSQYDFLEGDSEIIRVLLDRNTTA
jgi:8-oxo-dGTP diphosphatase